MREGDLINIGHVVEEISEAIQNDQKKKRN